MGERTEYDSDRIRAQFQAFEETIQGLMRRARDGDAEALLALRARFGLRWPTAEARGAMRGSERCPAR